MPFSNKTLIIIVAVALLIGGWFVFGGDSDERAIRRQLDRLVELVEKDEPISQFESLGRSRKFKDHFAENSLIEYLPGRSLPRGGSALQSGFLSVLGQVDAVSVRVSQHEVQVDADAAEASSTFYALCSVRMNGSERMRETVQYRAYWVKVEGDWLIERIVAENTQ